MWSPPTTARCARTERTVHLDQRTSPFRTQRQLETYSIITLSFSLFYNFQTCMSTPRMQRAWKCGTSGKYTAPPRRVGIRPRFSARSIRLPPRVLHCSCDFASKQTISSEWGSARRRASTCHRACSSVADELAELHATDASPSGAGGCAAAVTQEDWLALCDLAEEKGEHVRLDWEGEEPPRNMHDGRAVAAPLALKLNWVTMFSYRFFKGKHINPLELESLISLLRRITREGTKARRLLVLADSRVFFWEPSQKGQIELAKSQHLAAGICMGAHLVESGGCPFTEQTDPELVCIVAKAPASSDRSLCGAYSVRTCAHTRILRCLQLFGSETCVEKEA